VETRRRKHWGWGYEHEQPAPAQLREQGAAVVAHLGFGRQEVEMPVALADVKLSQPRVQPPAALAEICDSQAYARASHALGKSYCDVVRGFRGVFAHPPDFVAAPREEHQIEALLEWCEAQRVAAIPFGGGTSVVGGVEPKVPDDCNGAISIDLAAMQGLLEVDRVSRAARIRAGTTGPAIEAALAHHDLTLRHFPQSFELSTLGGWIATRAGGHFATLWTHIDEMVESVRAVAPAGAWESRRLPGSGAGPSPDRMLIGSEGVLGVITEAWMRVLPRPGFRAQAGIRFSDFGSGAECVRQISQADLHPANCRLIDATEAGLTGAGDGRHAVLVLGFESADHSVAMLTERALAICAEHGGEWDQVKHSAPGSARSEPGGAGGAVSTWRNAFMQAPYLRDTLVAAGVLCETFETATTWERYGSLHERVIAAAEHTVTQTTGVACGSGSGQARVTCRLTHVYPDGPALYFTVLAPAVRSEEVTQWQTIKAAVSDALIEQGATITHHHAVGRDHRPWYDRQRPDLFAAALRGAKAQLDPHGIMNPGVLIDPAAMAETS
jgi:alkyldihydroxyacetonephosphate synthase